MFVVPYILVTCFILVQLNVQYPMFLKSLLAQHVSESETDRDIVTMCPNTITRRME
jgi:hypothetical protein